MFVLLQQAAASTGEAQSCAAFVVVVVLNNLLLFLSPQFQFLDALRQEGDRSAALQGGAQSAKEFVQASECLM